MRDVGFPCILTDGRSRYEAQAPYRRADHFDPEGARGRRPAKDLSSRHGVAENAIYRWKSKYSGMEASEAKRLRELKGENRKLKQLLVPPISVIYFI